MKHVTRPSVAATTTGKVRGVAEHSVTAFRGVPYAAAPVGELRYRPPVPPAAWDGERDASQFGVTAPQLNEPGGLFTPSLPPGEDCLTLNVWTPSPEPAGRPVLVWIHGGAFLFGTSASPMISKAAFARDGIVFVSVNYRLGSDGFLFAEDDLDSGNYGILDLVAALRWVQENIAAFGGDPAKVTVGGQSAGATAVAALLAAPAGRGLFGQAIMQSGYPDTLLSQESARLAAGEIYARAGLRYGDLDGLREIRDRDPKRVLLIQMELFRDVLSGRETGDFGPEISVSLNPFQPVVGTGVLPQRPAEALAARPSPAGLLIGCTAEEFELVYGAGMLSPDINALEAAFERAVPGRGAEALQVYQADRPGASAAELLTAMETDRLYRAPSTRLADTHARNGAPAYFYRFAWQSPIFRAGHSVDLPFVFDALDVPLAQRFTGPNPPQPLADAMHRSWLAFVTTGRPGHDSIPGWPRYSADRRAMLEFGPRQRVICDPGADELRFWSRPLPPSGAPEDA
jgi:para-nitrobenzyl esterase